MYPLGFEHAVLTSERPQTHLLDREASEIDAIQFSIEFLCNCEDYNNL